MRSSSVASALDAFLVRVEESESTSYPQTGLASNSTATSSRIFFDDDVEAARNFVNLLKMTRLEELRKTKSPCMYVPPAVLKNENFSFDRSRKEDKGNLNRVNDARRRLFVSEHVSIQKSSTSASATNHKSATLHSESIYEAVLREQQQQKQRQFGHTPSTCDKQKRAGQAFNKHKSPNSRPLARDNFECARQLNREQIIEGGLFVDFILPRILCYRDRERKDSRTIFSERRVDQRHNRLRERTNRHFVVDTNNDVADAHGNTINFEDFEELRNFVTHSTQPNAAAHSKNENEGNTQQTKRSHSLCGPASFERQLEKEEETPMDYASSPIVKRPHYASAPPSPSSSYHSSYSSSSTCSSPSPDMFLSRQDVPTAESVNRCTRSSNRRSCDSERSSTDVSPESKRRRRRVSSSSASASSSPPKYVYVYTADILPTANTTSISGGNNNNNDPLHEPPTSSSYENTHGTLKMAESVEPQRRRKNGSHTSEVKNVSCISATNTDLLGNNEEEAEEIEEKRESNGMVVEDEENEACVWDELGHTQRPHNGFEKGEKKPSSATHHGHYYHTNRSSSSEQTSHQRTQKTTMIRRGNPADLARLSEYGITPTVLGVPPHELEVTSPAVSPLTTSTPRGLKKSEHFIHESVSERAEEKSELSPTASRSRKIAVVRAIRSEETPSSVNRHYIHDDYQNEGRAKGPTSPPANVRHNYHPYLAPPLISSSTLSFLPTPTESNPNTCTITSSTDERIPRRITQTEMRRALSSSNARLIYEQTRNRIRERKIREEQERFEREQRKAQIEREEQEAKENEEMMLLELAELELQERELEEEVRRLRILKRLEAEKALVEEEMWEISRQRNFVGGKYVTNNEYEYVFESVEGNHITDNDGGDDNTDNNHHVGNDVLLGREDLADRLDPSYHHYAHTSSHGDDDDNDEEKVSRWELLRGEDETTQMGKERRGRAFSLSEERVEEEEENVSGEHKRSLSFC